MRLVTARSANQDYANTLWHQMQADEPYLAYEALRAGNIDICLWGQNHLELVRATSLKELNLYFNIMNVKLCLLNQEIFR